MKLIVERTLKQRNQNTVPGAILEHIELRVLDGVLEIVNQVNDTILIRFRCD
jgi:hypothetical protein